MRTRALGRRVKKGLQEHASKRNLLAKIKIKIIKISLLLARVLNLQKCAGILIAIVLAMFRERTCYRSKV